MEGLWQVSMLARPGRWELTSCSVTRNREQIGNGRHMAFETSMLVVYFLWQGHSYSKDNDDDDDDDDDDDNDDDNITALP